MQEDFCGVCGADYLVQDIVDDEAVDDDGEVGEDIVGHVERGP